MNKVWISQGQGRSCNRAEKTACPQAAESPCILFPFPAMHRKVSEGPFCENTMGKCVIIVIADAGIRPDM